MKSLFFEPGPTSGGIIFSNPSVALAICFELSVPVHARRAVESGATLYIASVAKTDQGVDEACRRLSGIARKYSVVAMMANCLGLLDGAECAGRSSAWDRNGNHLMELGLEHEGIIVLDFETQNVVSATLPAGSR